MAGIKDIGLRIRIPVAKETTDSQKHLDKMRKGFVELEKKELPKLTKTTKEYLKSTRDGLKEVEKASEQSGRTFSRSMEDGLRSLNKFTGGLSKLKDKVFNLKNALAGTAIGMGAIWAGHKLYEGGKASLALKGRISREFGDEADILERVAGRAGRRAGITNEAAITGLIPLRERLDDIEAGAQFRGMKRKLTADQAKALREKNLTFGSNMLARISTLAPDIDQAQAGAVLADALSGPEGIRRLVSEFNLSKRSKTIAAANEKGDVFKFLREDERKKYGVTKQGQFLEQGDLVDVLLSRSGLTNEAADAKRRKMDFQIKAIGATAENALAEIGSKALDRFNNGMGKGATLAEKFENALKSDQGKKIIDGIADGAVALADGLVKVATELPKIGGFLSEHKGSLLALGAAFGGLKIMSKVGGALGKEGGGGGILGMLGGAKPVPVFVTNMGGGLGGGIPGAGGARGALGKAQGLLGAAGAVIAAGSAGYAAGAFLDEQFGLSDKLAKGATAGTNAMKEFQGAQAFRQKLEGAAAAREGLIKALESQGMSHGQAVYQAGQAFNTGGYVQPQTINLVLDGKTVAKVVTEHQARDIHRKTAGGAAPRHGE